jgi:hypothetical protein
MCPLSTGFYLGTALTLEAQECLSRSPGSGGPLAACLGCFWLLRLGLSAHVDFTLLEAWMNRCPQARLCPPTSTHCSSSANLTGPSCDATVEYQHPGVIRGQEGGGGRGLLLSGPLLSGRLSEGCSSALQDMRIGPRQGRGSW